MGVLTSKDDSVAGVSAALSASEVEDASKNSNKPDQFFPICIHITDICVGGAIDHTVYQNSLLLLIHESAALASASATAATTMTGYGIVSLLSLSSSLFSSLLLPSLASSLSPYSINCKLMYVCWSFVRYCFSQYQPSQM